MILPHRFSFANSNLLFPAFRRQIRMTRDAHRIAAFEVMTRGARFHIAAREHRVLAAAAAFAEANEIRGAMRQRERRSKTGILITRMAIRAKRLLIVA